jgi:hypothetical protein
MKRERNAAAVNMAIMTMAGFLSLQLKTIELEGGC